MQRVNSGVEFFFFLHFIIYNEYFSSKIELNHGSLTVKYFLMKELLKLDQFKVLTKIEQRKVIAGKKYQGRCNAEICKYNNCCIAHLSY